MTNAPFFFWSSRGLVLLLAQTSRKLRIAHPYVSGQPSLFQLAVGSENACRFVGLGDTPVKGRPPQQVMGQWDAKRPPLSAEPILGRNTAEVRLETKSAESRSKVGGTRVGGVEARIMLFQRVSAKTGRNASQRKTPRSTVEDKPRQGIQEK